MTSDYLCNPNAALLFYFFFQAEDGIRDKLVTGVQTCALPISRTFHSPSFTIEATANRRADVTWVNQLVDRNGRYLPHLLPVDQTLHWANPPGGLASRDRSEERRVGKEGSARWARWQKQKDTRG